MQSRPIRRSGQPTCAGASSNAGFWPGPDPRRALCPAVTSTAQIGRTHGCTDQPANVKKSLANSEPSTHGTSRHFAAAQQSVAFGAKRTLSRLQSRIFEYASYKIRMMKLQMRVGGMFWCAAPPPADWMAMPVAAALTATPVVLALSEMPVALACDVA